MGGVSVLRVENRMTVRWSCQTGDVVIWTCYDSIVARHPRVVDYWRLGDGEQVLLTNQWEDIPPWFELHPTEVKDSYAFRMLKMIENGDHPTDIIDGPNIWRVCAGDRLIWTGLPRPDIPRANGVLQVADFWDDCLVLGPMRLVADMLSAGAAVSVALSDEEEGRCEEGYSVAGRLGLPRIVSIREWALG